MQITTPPVPLVGDRIPVACADGMQRPYLSLDAAASTRRWDRCWPGSGVPALVFERPPRRGLQVPGGYRCLRTGPLGRSCLRRADRPTCGRATTWRSSAATPPKQSTTWRTASGWPSDVVVTTVVEHHANLLPWSRVATCRYVECDRNGTFGADDVVAALDQRPAPRLLAITGASNITGWMPPLDEIIAAARDRGIPVVVDAAQFAPHRPLPADADFLAWSGHKMYAPFGAGVLVGPTRFADGDPFLAGGGAVDLVDLDEVLWTDPPEREEAGSPNVLGAVALHAAIEHARRHRLARAHQPRAPDRAVAAARPGLDPRCPPARARRGCRDAAGRHLHRRGHAPRAGAARLAAEYAIGVRHGCFCAHPYLMRLLGLSPERCAATATRCATATAARCRGPSAPAPASTPPAPTSRGCSTRWHG